MRSSHTRSASRCYALALIALVWAGLAPASAGADLREERMIGPGVKYTHLRRDAGPWAIHVLEIDGTGGYIRPSAVPARPEALALEPVSRIAERVTADDRYPIAAVNGDFFLRGGASTGDPVGAAIWDGELLSTPAPLPTPRSALILPGDGTPSITILGTNAWCERPDGTRFPLFAANQSRTSGKLIVYTPRFGPATGTKADGVEVVLGNVELPLRAGRRFTGAVASVARGVGNVAIPADGVVLSGQGAAAQFLSSLTPGDMVSFRIDLQPRVPEDVNVISGGPRLVRDGRRSVEWEAEGIKPDVAQGRAPRTAVGITGRRLVIVTVDGRQSGVSVGMTLAELADFMLEMGCADALNLDGGGSSCMWVRGTVQNRPSDGRERPVANALMVFSTAPKGPPVRINVLPGELAVLPGTAIPLQVRGEDAFYNPVEVAADQVEWRVDHSLGAFDPEGRFVALSPPRAGGEDPSADPAWKSGLLWARVGDIRSSVRVRVYRRPPRLEITPGAINLASGSARRLEVRAYDEAGRPLLVPPDALRWEVTPEVGAMEADGTLRAVAGRARGTVVAQLLGTRATAEVSVGTFLRPLDDFENGTIWAASSVPAGVPGAVALAAGRARSGAKALKLSFDFTTTTATRAVYAQSGRPIGRPLALRLWFSGNAGGSWLRARLRGSDGQLHMIDFGRDLEPATDWRPLVASIPEEALGPLTLESIYVVQPDPAVQARGVVYVDDLVGEYAGVE